MWTHLAVAVLHEVVQWQRAVLLVGLELAKAGNIVLFGQVVPFQLPLVFGGVHGEHPILDQPSVGKSKFLDDVDVHGGVDFILG